MLNIMKLSRTSTFSTWGKICKEDKSPKTRAWSNSCEGIGYTKGIVWEGATREVDEHDEYYIKGRRNTTIPPSHITRACTSPGGVAPCFKDSYGLEEEYMLQLQQEEQGLPTMPLEPNPTCQEDTNISKHKSEVKANFLDLKPSRGWPIRHLALQ